MSYYFLEAVISITRSSRVAINLFLNSWRIQATQHSYKLSHAEIANRLIQQNEPTLFHRAPRKKLLQDGYCCQLYVLAAVYNMITD